MTVCKAFQPIGASVADKWFIKMHNHILDDSTQSFSTNRSECSRHVVDLHYTEYSTCTSWLTIAFQTIGASVADKWFIKMHNHILTDSTQSFSTNGSRSSLPVSIYITGTIAHWLTAHTAFQPLEASIADKRLIYKHNYTYSSVSFHYHLLTKALIKL